jgi:hypothetical protein
MRDCPRGGQKDSQDELGLGRSSANVYSKIANRVALDQPVAGEQEHGGVV